jgi:hypothetical protein
MNNILVRLDQYKTECGELYCATTGGKKAPVDAFAIPGALDRSAVSKGRNGDASLAAFRFVVQLFSMRKGARTRAEAESWMTLFASVIEELWPIKSVDFTTAMRHEQALDGTEDYHQVCALTDSVALSKWIQSAELYAGELVVAIASARARQAELERTARWAA